MKSRKNFAKTIISIATTLITLTFFAFGCGDAKTTADTPEETEKATEIVSHEETEKPEPATEVVAEEETEATEQETEEATEEPVLFRVSVTNSKNAYLIDQPSHKEYGELIPIDYGMEFDVFEVFENETEGYTFYRVNWEGKSEFLLDTDAQVIE